VTDGDSVGSGFTIVSRCVAPCQRINVRLDSTLSSHYPHQDNDGFYYIDLCPYDTLRLVAYGEYPDNNYSYFQSDAISIFHWDLGITVIDSIGYNTLNYYFPSGRGYDVSVNIQDTTGCQSYIPQIFRIRTSENPIRGVAKFQPMCTGSEINLKTGYDNISNIQIDSIGSKQLTTLRVTDTIFLPDGEPCGSMGCSYQSPVTFTSFNPTATITSPDDILYVRINLEHSFVGDIYIRLICPNQQSAAILKKYNGGSSNCSSTIPANQWGWNTTGNTSAWFGVPLGGNSHHSNDNSSNKCDPISNPPGTGWNYCWSNAINQGYSYANGNGYVYENVNVHNNSIDSTDVLNMTQVYHPDESFAGLVGCPMNGSWSIEVIDGYGSDNGWLFGWEMALNPSLLPQDWSYTVLVDTTIYTGPGANGSYIIPEESGNITYIATVIDEFGCAYDTNFTIAVTQ
ncbi:MAG: hypothetical protein RR034_08790, partial [Bacteroidales bacterium]